MEQVILRKNETEIKSEPKIKIELIILEELPVELEQPKEVEVKAKEKKFKKALLKLLKKGKYNAKYLEELASVNGARRLNQYRDFGAR